MVNPPTLVYNEFGKPSLDEKEVFIHMNETIINVLKSISKKDLEKYKEMVAKQKLKEGKD